MPHNNFNNVKILLKEIKKLTKKKKELETNNKKFLNK